MWAQAKGGGGCPPTPPPYGYPCVTPPVSIGGEAPPLVLWDPWDEVRVHMHLGVLYRCLVADMDAWRWMVEVRGERCGQRLLIGSLGQ